MNPEPLGAHHSALIARPRVLRKIRFAARRRIVVVHGEAGCGKSVAIGQYVAELREPRALFIARFEHAGVSAFARGLAQALAPVAPAVLQLLPFAFSSARRQTDPWGTIALWIAENLASPITIAVDQLHRLADDDRAFDFLNRLVDGTAPHVRWIFGTRSTAALPLPRWLASGTADASIDDSALCLEPGEVPGLAASVHADAAFVDSLRAQHAGAIGAIVDSAGAWESKWRTFEPRAEYLVALAALPHIDAEVLTHLPPQASDVLTEMEVALGPAFTGPLDGERRQLDERVRTRAYALAAGDTGTIDRGRILAARALEAVGRKDMALQLFVAARADGDVMRILGHHGFELEEGGSADIVAAAIASLPVAQRRATAIALMLEAIDEASRGRYDVSESWFEQALQSAVDDGQRMRVDIAYAVSLLRRGRADAFERLEALAATADDVAHAVSILASLATAHATADRLDKATACIAEALAALPGVDDIAVRATVHQRAAFVALSAGDAIEAERHATLAATLAAEHGNDELVAVARSVSYVVAVSYEDDPERALEALGAIAKASARLGNAIFRRFALIGSSLIHAERYDVSALAKVEAQLADEELEASRKHVDEGLLPARALHHSWTGDFHTAHQMLAFSAGRQPNPETRALRWAEIAFYAAVAGCESDANPALTNAHDGLRSMVSRRSVESLRARLLLALTLLVLGRRADAGNVLAEVAPDVAQWPRWRCVYAFISAAQRADDEMDSPEAMLGWIGEMHNAGLGGWAHMIASIPNDRLSVHS